MVFSVRKHSSAGLIGAGGESWRRVISARLLLYKYFVTTELFYFEFL
ncbi:hypothetical protein ppKF707_0492 [Metapseudomonas furukawaii]|uniref:Uncharacterized protein n=1 Tax=Metapseudomonas furukawaii TaxID=1149133 RepID=A0AAD1FEK9_METFU|nr:hypothetical protein ppKF707_0492 [Pseudomonas furukawaii]BAU73137.1 hypothetical protein KF707C_14490 [Pseudomonas furukawaii]